MNLIPTLSNESITSFNVSKITIILNNFTTNEVATTTAQNDLTEVTLENFSDLPGRGHYRLTDFYAIVAQLLLGLALNIVMLCSVLVSMRQVRMGNSSIVHRVNSANYRHVPVVDLVLAVASSIAILRLVARSALQIACFYGRLRIIKETEFPSNRT